MYMYVIRFDGGIMKTQFAENLKDVGVNLMPNSSETTFHTKQNGRYSAPE